MNILKLRRSGSASRSGACLELGWPPVTFALRPGLSTCVNNNIGQCCSLLQHPHRFHATNRPTCSVTNHARSAFLAARPAPRPAVPREVLNCWSRSLYSSWLCVKVCCNTLYSRHTYHETYRINLNCWSRSLYSSWLCVRVCCNTLYSRHTYRETYRINRNLASVHSSLNKNDFSPFFFRNPSYLLRIFYL